MKMIFLLFFLLGYGMIELSLVCYMIFVENNKYGFVGCILLNLWCKVRYYVNIVEFMN